MMINMGLQECDSFDEQDIDYLEDELQDIDGPSLRHFQLLQQDQPITPFGSLDIIKSLLDFDGRDFKFVGRQDNSAYRAFFFILLMIGVQQRRHYPHLNTLIRQQFYKPNIFDDQDQGKTNQDQAKAMLQKCLKYFQEIVDGIKIEDYILREPLFERACVTMLKNSIEHEDSNSIYEQLSDKFNIDMHLLKSQTESEVIQLGANRHFYIVRERQYFFVVTVDVKEEMNQSKIQNQSIRSIESGQQNIVEASDNSTPKFKNSQARYRKKSHKNSFGGDMEIVQYRDLLHLQKEKLISNKVKLLSDYFDANQIQSCAQGMLEEKMPQNQKKNSFQQIIDSQKIQMKGSTTIQPTHHQINHMERRKDRKISSSQIIQCRDFNPFNKNDHHTQHHHPTLHEEDEDEHHMKTNAYNSLVMAKDDILQGLKMRTSLIQHQQLERIQERQSSQRESTHPDQLSEPSQNIDMTDNDSQVKMKDRKYSYFTQQMASTKVKIQKQFEASNYVFKIPKNQHKNSQVIVPTAQQHQMMKRRFQQNPLRFSQLGSPSEDSIHDTCFRNERRHLHHNSILRLNSTVYSYQIKFEPYNWYKKQIIYYLPDNKKQIYTFQKSFGVPINVIPPNNKANDQSQIIRQSFGSANTLLSNIKMKQEHNLSGIQPSQKTNSYNPFELNQTSFLKNRIHSMANLDPNNHDHDDSRSNVFSTTRSLKNIHSNSEHSKTKVSFNYLPSGQSLSPNKRTNPQIVSNSNISGFSSFNHGFSSFNHGFSSINQNPQTIRSQIQNPTTSQQQLRFKQPPLRSYQTLSPHQNNFTRPLTFNGFAPPPTFNLTDPFRFRR